MRGLTTPTSARVLFTRIAAVAMLAGGVVPLAGCPSGSCILQVCNGNKCRCSISSCGDGAAFDVNQNRCRCLQGTLAISGQCLTPEEANEFCGVGQHWENNGCTLNYCNPGDELDLATGYCIPKQQVDQVAAGAGVQVGQGQKLGCPPGEKLVIDGGTAACIPLSQTCTKDEVWNGTACQKTVSCPTGSQWDVNLQQCATYASGGDELKVNVEQWAATNYGPNGGTGTPAFCGSFAKKPWSFGVGPGSSVTVRVQVMMSFPDGEISKGAVQTNTVYDQNNNPVPPKGNAEVDAAAKNTLKSLVQGGGRASAPTATTTVKCAIVSAGKPQAVPATGGV